MRESKVEGHLRQQVALRGGTTRKLRYLGAPDRLVLWPVTHLFGEARSCVHFVETKAPVGRLKSWQAREHKRLRVLGYRVFVLYSKQQVDHYISTLRHRI